MKKIFKILIFMALSMIPMASYANPSIEKVDIVNIKIDLNGDNNLELLKLTGNVDTAKYDLDSFNSFDYKYVYFSDIELTIDDFEGNILYKNLLPNGLFEKLVTVDFSGDKVKDILVTIHDENTNDIYSEIISFKDDVFYHLYDGTLEHNSLNSASYTELYYKDNYTINLKSNVSNFDITTCISKKNRHLYDNVNYFNDAIVYKNFISLSYPNFYEIDVDNDNVYELLEISKLISDKGEEFLSLNTIYRWHNDKWVPFSMTAEPLNYDINIVLNNEKLFFDSEPQIINDTTLVPMRVIFEALDADVTWDPKTNTATAHKNGSIIKLTLNKSTASINGSQKKLDTVPILSDNRVLVPVRFVSEALNTEVDWDNISRSVIIKNK